MSSPRYEVQPVGWIESTLVDLHEAPKQGDEGAPSAWLVFEPGIAEALADLQVGDRVILLSWLDRARRDVLTTHARGDVSRPAVGVFSTRSPERPNPIGLHPVEILAIDHGRLLVSNLEAIDGTPIIDIKPDLGPFSGR